MTDSPDTTPNDPSGDPAYTQLGEDGNPLAGGDSSTADQVPGDHDAVEDDESQNAPLPDWGPTDGEHGVDEPAQ